MKNINKRVIILDGGSFSHKAIFSWSAMKKLQIDGKTKSTFLPSSAYTYNKMILSFLKRIGITKDDLIIIAVDGRNSWRKAFYRPYKAQRKAMRKKADLIDWRYHYDKIDKVNHQLNKATNWHFIRLSNTFSFAELCQTKEGQKFQIYDDKYDCDEMYGIEADDIQAFSSKYFNDKEVILVTNDADLEQLIYYKNTKLFSMNIKFRNGTGCYKIVKNPKKILADKIRLGDRSDNILVSKSDTEEDIERRSFIINLLKLPDFIENAIKEIFDNLKRKKIYYDDLPFPNSLGKKSNFDQIYNSKNIITYEDAIKRYERQLKREKKKREEYKERQKKFR